jgi:hypothetical protein
LRRDMTALLASVSESLTDSVRVAKSAAHGLRVDER